MLINGRWKLRDDNVVRPVVETEVLAVDDTWVKMELLLDSGGDCTVLTASSLAALGLPHLPAPVQLGGVGGAATTVSVGTHIRFSLDTGGRVVFQGTFAAFTQPDALDMNVLGRDIMKLFAAIIDQPGDVVCMIGKGHRYSISKES
jgi:hypothetical protein